MKRQENEIQLPEGVTEEEATREIRQFLKSSKTRDGVLVLVKLLVGKFQNKGLSDKLDLFTNTEVYHRVCWELVSRGVLYPSPTKSSPYRYGEFGPVVTGFSYSSSFRLTPQGEQWLEEEDGIFNCLPTEYGRFSQFLQSYTEKFGDGYEARSREAVSCYRHRLFLSCCVMCGASTESIILRIRIEQSGDPEQVVADYSAKNGLEKLLVALKHNQDGKTVKKMEDIRELISYWRNSSAHGESSNLGEVEAFTALLLLLRFAHYVDQHWTALTES